MLRRKSDELPRFGRGGSPPLFRFQWRRRYFLYVCGLLFVCWMLYPSSSSSSSSRTGSHDRSAVDWSQFAYSLYATDSATLCHAVMIFDGLAHLGSKADRVLFYPEQWDLVVSSPKDRDSQLLVLARDHYGVKLHPIKLLSAESRTKDEWTGTWDNSVTKFEAFSLTYYDRVIALDSDITLLKHLDDLFLLPQTAIAMPRAYWTDYRPWPLTSLLMVIKPDYAEFKRLKNMIQGGRDEKNANEHRFDMELINERFGDSAMVLPHRPYALLSGEFRRQDHTAYLGNKHETWDAEKVFGEASLVHFSDWPLPKPWIMWPTQGLEEMQPDCGGSVKGTCAERMLWKELYNDFRRRRKGVCKLLSVPAPKWTSLKQGSHDGNSTKEEAPVVDGSIPVGDAALVVGG